MKGRPGVSMRSTRMAPGRSIQLHVLGRQAPVASQVKARALDPLVTVATYAENIVLSAA